jgi:hypothetical protein
MPVVTDTRRELAIKVVVAVASCRAGLAGPEAALAFSLPAARRRGSRLLVVGRHGYVHVHLPEDPDRAPRTGRSAGRFHATSRAGIRAAHKTIIAGWLPTCSRPEPGRRPVNPPITPDRHTLGAMLSSRARIGQGCPGSGMTGRPAAARRPRDRRLRQGTPGGLFTRSKHIVLSPLAPARARSGWHPRNVEDSRSGRHRGQCNSPDSVRRQSFRHVPRIVPAPNPGQPWSATDPFCVSVTTALPLPRDWSNSSPASRVTGARP